MRSSVISMCLGWVCALSPPALAQNILVNPYFDSDLSGWTALGGTAAWSAEDADGRPGSGGARLTTPATEGDTVASISQCVAVTGGSDYAFEVKLMRPSTEPQVSAFGSVSWFSSAGCNGFIEDETALESFPTTQEGWDLAEAVVAATAQAQSALVRLRARREDDEAAVVHFDNALFALDAPCIEDPVTLCLTGNRFRVNVLWRTRQTAGALAPAVRLTDDSAYFWFFNPENVEVVLKVLDACSTPFDKFWVFAAGLTNVQVEIVIEDMLTNEDRHYLNPFDQPFQPIQDTQAFDTCAGP
jgi:hypothetical protein